MNILKFTEYANKFIYFFSYIDYELFSQESRKRKFIPVINHPDIGDEMLKDDVRWKLAKNPGINTWTAIAKTWSQYDNAIDNAKCRFFLFLLW